MKCPQCGRPLVATTASSVAVATASTKAIAPAAAAPASPVSVLQCPSCRRLFHFTEALKAAAAIDTISNFARRRVLGRSAYTHMLSHGSVWTDLNASRKLSANSEIRRLSKANLSTLRKKLQRLNQAEIDFAHNFLKCTFYATHTTRADVIHPETRMATLYSRQALEAKGISFPLENSPKEDIAMLGNDDFVFFSLMLEGAIGKPSSRFGGRLLSFDLRLPAFQNAFMSLVEMRFATTPHTDRHITTVGFPHKEFSKRRLPPLCIVFHGADVIPGLLFSILLDLRWEHMPAPVRGELLATRSPMQLDRLINGLYRPEFKVPKRLVTTLFRMETVRDAPKPPKVPDGLPLKSKL